MLFAFSLGILACGDGPVDPDGPTALFPDLLSEIPTAGQMPFAPQFQLWTNGSSKSRHVTMTGTGTIDGTDPRFWDFPDGVRFTKTFAYRTEAAPQIDTKIETRVIEKVNGQWRTATYLWLADQSDAELLDGTLPTPVPVTNADGVSFSHVVPSNAQCIVCHGQRSSFVLGFRELQLNYTRGGQNHLGLFHNAGLFGTPEPENPATLDGVEAQTRSVLGYMEANCVHCHNSERTQVPDFSYDVFIANTVNEEASNGVLFIKPGAPEESEIFHRFSNGTMPPLGVDLLHDAGVTLVEDWIGNHNFSGGS